MSGSDEACAIKYGLSTSNAIWVSLRSVSGQAAGAADRGGGVVAGIRLSIRVWPVYLVEVNIIGVQAAQAVFNLCYDMLARVSGLVWAFGHPTGHVRRDDGLMSFPTQGLAYVLLRCSLSIGVGSVYEVNTHVQGMIDNKFGAFGVNSPPEVVGPQSNDRNLKSGLT